MAEITQVEVALSGPVAITSVVISEAPGADGAPGTNGADGADGADGVGVPVGGTTGQVLAKASGTDYDTEWTDAAAGSGDVVGPASAVTARIATFNGTTGKLIADGGSTIANVLDRANHTSTQAISTVTGLQAALDAKAASSHAHTISDTTGLQAALDAKAATSHTHASSDITGLAASATTDTTSASNISSGTLSIARVADGSVTLAKLANLAQSVILGRYTASTGVPEAITVGGDFSLSGGTLSLVINPTNASNLASGTVADARLSSNVPLEDAACAFTVNGAASTPAVRISGTIFTGGSTSTNVPQLLIEPTGTTSNAWVTSGTLLGINAPSGFAGQLMDVRVNSSTSARFRVDGTGIAYASNFSLIGDTGQYRLGVSLDVILSRDAAAALQMGADAASPIAQTFKACDARAGTDTNTVGGIMNIAAGRGTGTAAGGELRLQTSEPTSSGTAAGTLTTRLAISGTAITASKPIVLQAYTVATLPTGTAGMRAYVTDATAPTYLGALTGGGAVVCPVFYNGSAWVSC